MEVSSLKYIFQTFPFFFNSAGIFQKLALAICANTLTRHVRSHFCCWNGFAITVQTFLGNKTRCFVENFTPILHSKRVFPDFFFNECVCVTFYLPPFHCPFCILSPYKRCSKKKAKLLNQTLQLAPKFIAISQVHKFIVKMAFF